MGRPRQILVVLLIPGHPFYLCMIIFDCAELPHIITRMCSAANSHARLPCLPSELAQKILQKLSMRDICNVSQVSKSLWDLTCHLSSLHFSVNTADPFLVTSLHSFLRRRSLKGLRVTGSPYMYCVLFFNYCRKIGKITSAEVYAHTIHSDLKGFVCATCAADRSTLHTFPRR